MTRTLSTDTSNDLYLGADGNIAVASGLDGVLQACQTAVKARRGEMVLDVESGIPYFETAFPGAYNVAQFEAAIRATILAVSGVRDTAVVAVASGNLLSYTATIVTDFGTGTING